MNTIRILTAFVLLCSTALLFGSASSQEINFDKINKFETLGTGTLRVGAPPKTIVDDGERHIVILTIWDADAETKVYWRSPDANDARTTVIPGKGVQTFQTAGELRPIQARRQHAQCSKACRWRHDDATPSPR